MVYKITTENRKSMYGKMSSKQLPKYGKIATIIIQNEKWNRFYFK